MSAFEVSLTTANLLTCAPGKLWPVVSVDDHLFSTGVPSSVFVPSGRCGKLRKRGSSGSRCFSRFLGSIASTGDINCCQWVLAQVQLLQILDSVVQDGGARHSCSNQTRERGYKGEAMDAWIGYGCHVSKYRHPASRTRNQGTSEAGRGNIA